MIQKIGIELMFSVVCSTLFFFFYISVNNFFSLIETSKKAIFSLVEELDNRLFF